jgi:hypothetical protein
MHRQVKYARLQTALDLPGTVGGLGTTLPPTNKTLFDLKMEALDGGLLVNFDFLPPGAMSKVRMHKEILVPYPNVVLMELLPEERKKEK